MAVEPIEVDAIGIDRCAQAVGCAGELAVKHVEQRHGVAGEARDCRQRHGDGSRCIRVPVPQRNGHVVTNERLDPDLRSRVGLDHPAGDAERVLVNRDGIRVLEDGQLRRAVRQIDTVDGDKQRHGGHAAHREIAARVVGSQRVAPDPLRAPARIVLGN